ncbi:MAG: hypothetical protein GF416_06395 [Candidatus Altiarchaeales archaeon]|nr:hypothetical protein [Candidatus Altiarchaeales archaeon]MBD3416744.1 hypothetical protein [Candidatus Altiarchaeales archaeon]
MSIATADPATVEGANIPVELAEDPAEHMITRKEYDAYLKAARERARIPPGSQNSKGYEDIEGRLSGMEGMSRREARTLVKRVCHDPNRQGADCDLGGTWQPMFFAYLYYRISKDAGLKYDPIVPYITVDKLDGDLHARMAEARRKRFSPRRLLDGD